jgi:hypothetical protein
MWRRKRCSTASARSFGSMAASNPVNGSGGSEVGRLVAGERDDPESYRLFSRASGGSANVTTMIFSPVTVLMS